MRKAARWRSRCSKATSGDPKTLAPQIEKLRDRFGLKEIVLVGDRGMITAARIREDLRPLEGLAWITALRTTEIRGLVQRGTLQMSLFDEKDLAEIIDPAFPGERLVACRNPLLGAERARKREDLLCATERELAKIATATTRPKRRLRDPKKIAFRVGKVPGRFKVGKHFRWEITEQGLRYERDQDNIAQEAALDGVYVIRTSSPRHQREHAPAQVFTRVSGVAPGFRGQLGSNLFRELVVGIGFKPSAHGEPLGRLVSVPAVLVGQNHFNDVVAEAAERREELRKQ
jgi:hypothetical protein